MKEQVFHANIFTHGQSKTYSPDPELELQLELEVDPELEVEVLEATDVKDESLSMSFFFVACVPAPGMCSSPSKGPQPRAHMDIGSRTMHSLHLGTCSFTRVRCVPKEDTTGARLGCRLSHLCSHSYHDPMNQNLYLSPTTIGQVYLKREHLLEVCVPLFCIWGHVLQPVLELHVAHQLSFAGNFWHSKHWHRHILGYAHNARF